MINLAIIICNIFALINIKEVIGTESPSNLIFIHKPSSLIVQDEKITNISQYILNIYGIDGHSCGCKQSPGVIFKSPFHHPECVAIINIDHSAPFINKDFINVTLADTPHHQLIDENFDESLDNIKNELLTLSSKYANKDGQPLIYFEGIEGSNQFESILLSFTEKMSQTSADEIKDLLFIRAMPTEFSKYTGDPIVILQSFIDKIKDTLQAIYGENYVLLLLISDLRNFEDKQHQKISRKIRALEENTEAANDDEGLDRIWTSIVRPTPAKYSVTFNIILWLSILMALAVYAIVVALWHMNPGRDSIIYRVTNPRYNKKDL